MSEKLCDINKLPFNEAVKVILAISNSDKKLSSVEIEFILNVNEKELVNIFFDEYRFFSMEDFLLIESFINKNIEHENKEFLSDLIYFAADFGLDLNYKKVLEMCFVKEEDVNNLVLACLEYLHHNLKLLYVDEIINTLKYIRNNTIYHQNEQVLASLILFRITHKDSYLNFILELILNDESNLIFFKNILNIKIYNKKYFNSEVFYDKFNHLKIFNN